MLAIRPTDSRSKKPINFGIKPGDIKINNGLEWTSDLMPKAKRNVFISLGDIIYIVKNPPNYTNESNRLVGHTQASKPFYDMIPRIIQGKLVDARRDLSHGIELKLDLEHPAKEKKFKIDVAPEDDVLSSQEYQRLQARLRRLLGL